VNLGWKRKLRFCACYLLREVAFVFADGRFAHALDVAERHYDGGATFGELKAAIAESQLGYEVHRNDLDGDDERAAQALSALTNDTASGSVSVAYHCGRRAFDEQQNAAGVALLRELFGNPFRPVAFDPSWRTDTAVALARQMYDSRDFGAMPILADALQDAGCEDEQVLSHCRDATAPHVRGCWVVDLVLGKA
jgi:hypothetical protein